MNTTTWRKLFAMGFVVTAFAAGCVITSDDDDDENNGGTSGSGGSSAGRGGGGSGGKAGAGGKAGSGGSDNVSCTDPIQRDDAGVENSCQRCIQRDCCQEYLDCYNEDATCAQRIVDIQDCILDSEDPTDEDVKRDCVSEFGETNAAANALFSCIDVGDKGDAASVQGCTLESFESEVITD